MDLRHHSSTAFLRPSFLAKIVKPMKQNWHLNGSPKQHVGGLFLRLLQSANVSRVRINSHVVLLHLDGASSLVPSPTSIKSVRLGASVIADAVTIG